MTTNNLPWIEATHAVASAKSILVVAHLAPDGDAIGTLLGLSRILSQRGKTVTSAVDGGVPDFLQFMVGTDAVHAELTEGEWDLMIAVDCGDDTRAGEVGKYGSEHSKAVINIDHHPTNNHFGDINIVIAEAVSASEIVFDWATQWDVRWTADLATPLLTGLVTDTKGFRTSNVSEKTLYIAQELMRAGASLTEITARALDNKSYNAILLWKRALQSVNLNGQVIEAVVTSSDLKSVGMTEASDGGLVSLLDRVAEAMVAVVFKERLDGRVDVSMRAKPGYDVGTLAVELGGGGHTQAAGATVDGPMEDARKRVLEKLQEVTKLGTLNIA